jgi:Zn-dependent peptidase ImmA (M78 family)
VSTRFPSPRGLRPFWWPLEAKGWQWIEAGKDVPEFNERTVRQQRHHSIFRLTKHKEKTILSTKTMNDPKRTFAQRLAQARKMRGLSLRALAGKLAGRISHNALHKYERAQMMPDSEVLIALADALDQDVDFFFRAPSLELKELQFRKASRLGVREEEAIRERAVDYFERHREIEELLGIASQFKNPLADSSVRRGDEVEEAAGKLREEWRLGEDPLPNVREMLESKGIMMFEVDAPESFNGFAGRADGHPAIVLAKWLDRDLPRKRFTALHEVGHLLLKFPPDMASKDQETLCHRFAGAMLIPRRVFTAEFGGHRQHVSLAELANLKARYGLSIAALMHRALDLELITPAMYRRFCIVSRQKGWHKQEPGDYAGRESSGRFEQLVVRAASEAVISESKGAALLNEPFADFRERLAGVE